MKAIITTVFEKLKCGMAFQFDECGEVWVKCRGGFRCGRGGQLHSCQPNVRVTIYGGSQ